MELNSTVVLSPDTHCYKMACGLNVRQAAQSRPGLKRPCMATDGRVPSRFFSEYVPLTFMEAQHSPAEVGGTSYVPTCSGPKSEIKIENSVLHAQGHQPQHLQARTAKMSHVVQTKGSTLTSGPLPPTVPMRNEETLSSD